MDLFQAFGVDELTEPLAERRRRNLQFLEQCRPARPPEKELLQQKQHPVIPDDVEGRKDRTAAGRHAGGYFHDVSVLLVKAPSNILFWRMSRSEEHKSELQSLMRISYAVFCLK